MYGGEYYGGVSYGSLFSSGVLTIIVNDVVNDTDFITIIGPTVNTLIINCLNPLQGFWASGLVRVGP